MSAPIADTTSRLLIAQMQIESARAYTLTLLNGLTKEDWFWIPELPAPGTDQPALKSSIAWQVGHMAYAQYGLVLFRQRGRLREDADLMSTRFRKLFAKGTEAVQVEDCLTLDEIRSTFDGIYQQALKEMPTFDEDALDEPVDMPYAGFPTRYGSLIFAAHHEMLHAGQVGILRRLMGKPPVR